MRCTVVLPVARDDAGNFTPSHPMNHIAFGYVDATDACG